MIGDFVKLNDIGVGCWCGVGRVGIIVFYNVGCMLMMIVIGVECFV